MALLNKRIKKQEEELTALSAKVSKKDDEIVQLKESIAKSRVIIRARKPKLDSWKGRTPKPKIDWKVMDGDLIKKGQEIVRICYISNTGSNRNISAHIKSPSDGRIFILDNMSSGIVDEIKPIAILSDPADTSRNISSWVNKNF